MLEEDSILSMTVKSSPDGAGVCSCIHVAPKGGQPYAMPVKAEFFLSVPKAPAG